MAASVWSPVSSHDADTARSPAITPSRVLEYPSGTTVRFVALVASVVLASAFVGEWMHLSTQDTLAPPPRLWLAAPPVLVLLTAVVVTALAPAWLERRRGWQPLPAEHAGAASARCAAIAHDAGVRRPPTLTWNPTDAGVDAAAYGRPGAYRIALTPALVGAARRAPDRFDAVIRHEMAHVAAHDVALAYFAAAVWYVLLPVLALPLLWRLVDHDLSLVPEYLLRVVVVALVVYVFRAALLRSREHYADLVAATGGAAATAAALGSNRDAPRPYQPLFALHPRPEARVEVVAHAWLLARLPALEVFAVAAVASWGLPLVEQLASGGEASYRATQVSRWLVFGLVGAHLAAVVARSVGGGMGSRGLGRTTVALGAGLSVGSVFSLANTALVAHAGGEVAGSVVTALVCAALVPFVADLAGVAIGDGWDRARGRRAWWPVVAAAAVVFALAADSVTSVSMLVELGAASYVLENLPFAVGGHDAALALGGLLAAIGIVALLAAPRRVVTRTVVVGVAVGVVSLAVLVLVRVDAGPIGDDLARADRYAQAVWWSLAAGSGIAAMVLAAGRDVRGRVAAPLGGTIALVVGAVVVSVVGDALLGQGLDLSVATTVRFAGSLAVLLAPIGLGVGWFVGRPTGLLVEDASLRWMSAAVALAAVAVLVVAVVPDAVRGPATRGGTPIGPSTELAQFLDQNVAAAMVFRDDGLQLLAAAREQPADRAGEWIRTVVIPSWDNALMFTELDLGSPDAVAVNEALIELLVAERDELVAEAALYEGTGSAADHEAAVADADAARQAWAATYASALDAVGGTEAPSRGLARPA